MARTRLSGANFVARGYGQVEPNHLSAQRNGKIYAQLPAAADIEVLENGMFAKYDYETGLVNFTGDGEFLLVFNEVKTYRDFETYEDFAMIKGDYNARVYSPVPTDMPAGTTMVPRLFKTDIGDIMTTNCIKEAPGSLAVGNKLTPGADGYLSKNGADVEGAMIWKVVKVYTLADGQPAVKLQRVK